MPEVYCRREGVRVVVDNEDKIEAIIYTDEGIPEFCDEYEINLGGIKVNTHFNISKDSKVRVSLFDNQGNKLEIDSRVVSTSVKSSIIKFDDLSSQEYDMLCNMLTWQQPIKE